MFEPRFCRKVAVTTLLLPSRSLFPPSDPSTSTHTSASLLPPPFQLHAQRESDVCSLFRTLVNCSHASVLSVREGSAKNKERRASHQPELFFLFLLGNCAAEICRPHPHHTSHDG